jgi:macrolide transport system ATP-binding/permease protein
MNVIELKNLNKSYYLLKNKIPILNDINLEIKRGEFVAVMGYSGSGKSTLLNVLGLLDKPSEGSYKLDGSEVLKLSENKLAMLRNCYLGFIFQQFNLLPRLTVLENVTLPTIYSNFKSSEFYENPVDLLKKLGLGERINHHPNEISGGQQQKVAIARALINKPSIIFADEPTGNLDTKSSKEIMEILKNLNTAGITVIMVTHELEIASYATRTIKIKDGRIIHDKKIVQKTNTPLGLQLKPVDSKNRAFSLQKIKSYFIEAVKSSIKRNKLRSLLSILGVTIGVSSLIVTLAVGKGSQKKIEEQFAKLGMKNVLTIFPGSSKQRTGVSSNKHTSFKLKNEDIYDIKNNISGIMAVVGYKTEETRIVSNNKNCNTTLVGVSEEYKNLKNLQLHSGRFFAKSENTAKKKIALIGKTVVKKIYGSTNFNPVGKHVKINRMDFQVIGVLPDKGFVFGADQDDEVLIPLNTAMYRFFGAAKQNFLDYIDVKVENSKSSQKISENIIKRLLFTHKIPNSAKDSIGISNWTEFQKVKSSSTKTLSLLLGSIAVISLLVGGIGIMNIMMVSISERTKEIGVRKAIGADNKDIMFQFITESVIICSVGGSAGVLFGICTPILLHNFLKFSTCITLFSIGLAFCFSIFIGLVFGVLPARKAAILNPVDALRFN